MKWVIILLLAAAVLSVVRIVTQVRRATQPQEKDWDARFIGQLRKAGIAPFEPQLVDFFFALPTEAACTAVSAVLTAEGYAVDSKADTESGGYSLHAQQSMRLLVPDMQALTARFRQLAGEQGGTYDGWAVAKGKRGA